MGSNCSIYGLMDPFSGQVHYVGRSLTPKKRYKKHMRQGKKLLAYLKRGNRLISKTKEEWIAHLLLKGKSPTMVIIEIVPVSKAQIAEDYWYDICLEEFNMPLMNKIRAKRKARK